MSRFVGYLLITLLLAGCIIDPADPPPCDCPEFEAVMSDIQWIPGAEPIAVLSSRDVLDPDMPTVTVRYTAEAPAAVVDRLRTALSGAGFIVDDPGRGVLAATAGDLRLSFSYPDGVRVVGSTSTPDALPAAVEALRALELELSRQG